MQRKRSLIQKHCLLLLCGKVSFFHKVSGNILQNKRKSGKMKRNGGSVLLFKKLCMNQDFKI